MWQQHESSLDQLRDLPPPTEHIDLPHHTVGELHSIGHLKVWEDTHKLHFGMVYLLVRVDDTSKLETMAWP